MKHFTCVDEACAHWDNFFLEKEEKILKIEPFTNLAKEKIETLFQSYQTQLNTHIIFAQDVNGYNSPELAKILKQRLQGMQQYVDVLKNYFLNTNLIHSEEKKEHAFNVLVQQALTELYQSPLEKSVYGKLAHLLCLCIDPNQYPRTSIELKKEIEAVLSDPHLQTKQALEQFAQIISVIEQQMKRVERFVEPTFKNKLSFIWRELATAEVEYQLLQRNISILEQIHEGFVQQENELQEKMAGIQHFKHPFLSLIGEAQRRLAITRWNNMISQVENIFLALNLKENTGSLDYQHWPNPTKYLLISAIIPILSNYRESFNRIESLVELIPKEEPLSLLHESIDQRLKENLSEIESTVRILQSLVPFIKQTRPQNQQIELLIKKFELWIEKKQLVTNRYSNLPPAKQPFDQNAFNLEVFLFKNDFFDPEILALEKEILNRQKPLLEVKYRLIRYQEQMHKHIAFVEDPNLVSGCLLKAVLMQRLNKVEAYVKLLETLTSEQSSDPIRSLSDQAQNEIQSILARDVQTKTPTALEEGKFVLIKIRKIDEGGLNIKECLSALQTVKALSLKQGIDCVAIAQFIDVFEKIMVDAKPFELNTLSAMDKHAVQKKYLQLHIQQKQLFDLCQTIDPSNQNENDPIKNISEQLFGQTLALSFNELRKQAHEKENELRAQFIIDFSKILLDQALNAKTLRATLFLSKLEEKTQIVRSPSQPDHYFHLRILIKQLAHLKPIVHNELFKTLDIALKNLCIAYTDDPLYSSHFFIQTNTSPKNRFGSPSIQQQKIRINELLAKLAPNMANDRYSVAPHQTIQQLNHGLFNPTLASKKRKQAEKEVQSLSKEALFNTKKLKLNY